MPEKDLTVVVTGMGAVTPFGMGVQPFWESVLRGDTAVSEVEDEVWKQWLPVSANVPAIDIQEYLSKKQIKNGDRFTHLALMAAGEAMHDAGLLHTGSRNLAANIPLDRTGIAVGTAYGGVHTITEGAVSLVNQPGRRISPRLLPKSLPNAAAAALAKTYHIQGPVLTYTTACAASANAIGEAMHWLKRGEVDVVLAGGAEYLFSPAVLAGLRASGAVVARGDGNPNTWSRPFDAERKGMVPGEGAAFLVLESWQHARHRQAPMDAALAGYGASNDAYHETSPRPDGEAAALAMNKALNMADMKAENVDYINAHATATLLGDPAEAAAIEKVFQGAYPKTPVSSIKGSVGHMMGAAAAIESIASIKALKTGWVPPTSHCNQPDSQAPPFLIREAVQREPIYALSNSFGFGGQNGSLIWKKL